MSTKVSPWSEDHRISDPVRVQKILAKAEERRQRRGIKSRVLIPRERGIQASESRPASQQYRREENGQIVGHPRLMREVKQEARRTRLMRRANHRIGKRFETITKAATA